MKNKQKKYKPKSMVLVDGGGKEISYKRLYKEGVCGFSLLKRGNLLGNMYVQLDDGKRLLDVSLPYRCYYESSFIDVEVDM